MKKVKIKIILSGAAVLMAVLLFTGSADAADGIANQIQPAEAPIGSFIYEYGSYIETTTAWHFRETAYFPDVHIGQQGLGGVTFFNGTIANETTDEWGGGIPVTFGDDVRIDGELWRGPSKGTSDGMPLKISDTMVPTLTDINNFGDSARRWKNGYFTGTVWMGKLGGNNVVTEENLHATNNPMLDYVLAYDGSGKFRWMDISGATGGDGYANSWSATGTGNTRNITIGMSGQPNVNGTINVADNDSSTTNEIQGVISEQGLRVDGSNNFGLINTCSNNEVLKYDSGGSKWACAPDSDTVMVDYRSDLYNNPTTQDSKIITGRIQIAHTEYYDVIHTITLPTNYFTDVKSYTVTATYEYDTNYGTKPTQDHDNWPILVERINRYQFNIFTNLTGYSQPEDDLWVSWQAIGY